MYLEGPCPKHWDTKHGVTQYFQFTVFVLDFFISLIFIYTNESNLLFSPFIKFCDESCPAILNIVNVFSRFPNYLPLEKDWALYLNKRESLHPKMLCAKFCWNWSGGSGEEHENVKSLPQWQRQWLRETTDS